MNKAFVREPDQTGEQLCPRCDTAGLFVRAETLACHLSVETRSQLGETAYYCAEPRCMVAYFDFTGRTVAATELLDPAYPKDPAAPLCRCFDFTWEEIEADLAEGAARRVRALLAESTSSAAHCTRSMPDGRCCAETVQKAYLRRYAERHG